MQIDPNQPDHSLDKVLAALRNAAPPENMQARITQRLQQAPVAAPPPSRLRSFLIGATPTAAWTRGALTGAAFAAAVVLCALPLLRRSPTPLPQQALSPSPTQSTSTTATNINLPIERKATTVSEPTPCARHTIAPRHTTQAPSPAYREIHSDISLRAMAPSHPAPPLPLTAQERQLVRLVRVASPATLASLNPEARAKQEAEESANFQKFFALAPRIPLASETNPEATHPLQSQVVE